MHKALSSNSHQNMHWALNMITREEKIRPYFSSFAYHACERIYPYVNVDEDFHPSLTCNEMSTLNSLGLGWIWFPLDFIWGKQVKHTCQCTKHC